MTLDPWSPAPPGNRQRKGQEGRRERPTTRAESSVRGSCPAQPPTDLEGPDKITDGRSGGPSHLWRTPLEGTPPGRRDRTRGPLLRDTARSQPPLACGRFLFWATQLRPPAKPSWADRQNPPPRRVFCFGKLASHFPGHGNWIAHVMGVFVDIQPWTVVQSWHGTCLVGRRRRADRRSHREAAS
jgi:hypothetical protein